MDIPTKDKAAARQKIRRLFSEHPEVRAEAVELLKECWNVDGPVFDLDEMRECPDTCSLMAAKRDGHKEVIQWLLKL